MSTEIQIEAHRALREAQRRYTYFLLAAAGAAFAFAVNQTQGMPLSLSQVPLGFAVAAWGLSFFYGCRHLAYVSSNLYANVELLNVESGQHPEVGNHPDYIAAASQGIRSAFEKNADRANRFGQWQFGLLIVGSVLYLAWHVWEMYILSAA